MGVHVFRTWKYPTNKYYDTRTDCVTIVTNFLAGLGVGVSSELTAEGV